MEPSIRYWDWGWGWGTWIREEWADPEGQRVCHLSEDVMSCVYLAPLPGNPDPL